MITQEHQELLRKAVATNEKETVKSVFQKVLKEEFGAIRGLNQVAQDYLNDLTKLMEVPYNTEVKTSQDEQQDDEQTSNGRLLHFLISLIALVVVAVISAKLELIWGICIAFVVVGTSFVFAKKSVCKENPISPSQPKVSLKAIYREDVVIGLTDDVVKMMKGLVDELRVSVHKNGNAIHLPLHECYPDILEWWQMVYADAKDFDDEAKKYLLKRIVNIAYSNYYDVVEYNGDNENLFEKEFDNELTAVEMHFPAIIFNKTGKVVLSGKIFVPLK